MYLGYLPLLLLRLPRFCSASATVRLLQIFAVWNCIRLRNKYLSEYLLNKIYLVCDYTNISNILKVRRGSLHDSRGGGEVQARRKCANVCVCENVQ